MTKVTWLIPHTRSVDAPPGTFVAAALGDEVVRRVRCATILMQRGFDVQAIEIAPEDIHGNAMSVSVVLDGDVADDDERLPAKAHVWSVAQGRSV